jgi:peptidoglycan/xylan/chitin deacetylase (PgdA/CDA1 family)
MREHDLRNVEQTSWTQFTDFAGDRGVYAPLDVESMKTMQMQNLTFGAHTMSHPILSALSREDQQSEIRGSRAALSAAGIPVSPVFAYPNGQPGDWNNDTEAVLKEEQLTAALTTCEGVNTAASAPFALRRMVLDDTDDFAVFANVVSGVRLFLKSLRT